MSFRLPPIVVPVFLALLCACAGTPQEPVTISSVWVSPDSVSVNVGESIQLSVTLRDAAGRVLSGRSTTWSSSEPAKATVSPGGLVNVLAAGRVVITATSEGRTGQAVVIGRQVQLEMEILDAQFTQGVQASDGSLSMVMFGLDAAVNVLVRSTLQTSQSVQVALRLFDAAGNLVHTQTKATSGPLGPVPTWEAPSVQFLVPASVLTSGTQWQVVRDPNGILPDTSAANDVFPRSGRAALATATVPALKVRFVPIVLSSHGNATGLVTEATLPEYLRTTRSILPLGGIEATIGEPFTSAVSFGTAPSGGQSAFWLQVLGELDVARIAHPTASAEHWYGVVRPPPGFTWTTFGGFAYVPTSGGATGPGTRTATGVQINWFNNPTQARDLVAHELAHNFGRRHAPCGGATGTDPLFPVAGGLIGLVGHDVYLWSFGFTTSAPAVPSSTGDVMGYCFPVWSSEYTWRGVRDFRQGLVAAPQERTRVIVLRGGIVEGRITLEPAFVLEGRPSAPERAGAYRLALLAADGRVLRDYAFAPAEVDHAPNVGHFTFAIPVTPALEDSIASVRVWGWAAEARLSRPAGDAARVPRPQPLPIRRADGLVEVACADASARGILVLDGATGAVLGIAPAASMRVAVGSGRRVTLACSDGIATARASATAP